MNKQSAINLVQTTFERPYNRDRFLSFAKNIFHSFEDAPFIYRGNYIPDAYKKQIKTLERIGKYEDKEGNKIDILTVCVSQGTTLERARTLQRNFISWYLNGSRGDVTKDAALVAFYVEGSNDWRLSLVKMEYRLDKSESGRLKTFTELTPAKRFSFFVGEGENTHTAQRQLLPVLLREDTPPTLSDLEKAFSVEVVTKEFFEKYKQLFLDTKEALDKILKSNPQIQNDFQDKNIDTVDFTKKLLGQIVFLYFLQKKGWFGVSRDENWGTGPREFLRLLFEKSITDYDNYFNDILEPLFYEALAIERPDDFYSRFNCKIPFLNGGLFDPLNNYDWVHTDIHLPNYLFSNDKLTKEGDKGTGILDVFDRYNFTVKEDEPLEKEVAVDPEMLGKVFENLLEVKDRKSKGTYYTPREIVHYMCQESLVNYLVTELDGKVEKEDIETLIQIGESAVEHDTQVTKLGEETETYSYKLPASVRQNAKTIDEALVNIRVCDPAVGSGAFLVGMMTEIIRVRNTISSYLVDGDRSIYTFKHHAIQNSLYGVDIDPGATEIAKLRLWLSLIVDEQDIKRIKPLPNLDYKIMQGNSLLEEYEGIKLFDEELFTKSIFDNTAQVAEIKAKMSELQREFFELYKNNELRGVKKQQIDAELKKYSDRLKKLTKAPKPQVENGSLFDQVSEAQQKSKELKRLQREFFDTAHKQEKDRIKKQIEALTWEFIEATLREQGKESLTREIDKFKKTNVKPFFLWRLNFSEVFEKNDGFNVVIANPPYVSAWNMEKDDPKMRAVIKEGLREYPFLTGHWDLYVAFVAFGHRILNTGGVLCFIVPNPILKEKYAKATRKFLLENMTLDNILEFSDINVFENVSRRTTVFIAAKKVSDSYKIRIFGNKETNGEIVLSNSVERELWLKQPNHQFVLSINTKEEDLLKKLEDKSSRVGNYFYVNYGVQPSSKVKGKFSKSDVVSDIPTGNSKKFFEGKDVQRWYVSYRGLWLDYRKEELYGARAPELFENNKIVIRKVSDKGHKVAAAFDTSKMYTDDGNVIVVPYSELNNSELKSNFTGFDKLNGEMNLKYALALLISNVQQFYYKKRFATESLQGSTSHTYPASVRGLIIHPLSTDNQKKFIELVDKILDLVNRPTYKKNEEDQSKVYQYEEQLNNMVYELYELTPDEKDVIKSYGRNK